MPRKSVTDSAIIIEDSTIDEPMTLSENVLIAARQLRKDYGSGTGLVRVLDAVDLEVAPGETVAVMGPSGCGKSTLLQLLGGLDRPSSGQVLFRERRVDQLSERALAQLRRREIGFVFQASHLLDELTAQEDIELPALLARRSPRQARRRALRLLEQLGLGERASHLPSQPSLAGSANAWPSPGRWSTNRRRSSPTSRQGTSTAQPRWRCSGSSTRCALPGSRWSSSPTTSESPPLRTG